MDVVFFQVCKITDFATTHAPFSYYGYKIGTLKPHTHIIHGGLYGSLKDLEEEINPSTLFTFLEEFYPEHSKEATMTGYIMFKGEQLDYPPIPKDYEEDE